MKCHKQNTALKNTQTHVRQHMHRDTDTKQKSCNGIYINIYYRQLYIYIQLQMTYNVYIYVNIYRERDIQIYIYICYIYEYINIYIYLCGRTIVHKTVAKPGTFQGRGVFLELGHFDKHSPTTQERKAPQGKNIRFFRLETLKNTF